VIGESLGTVQEAPLGCGIEVAILLWASRGIPIRCRALHAPLVNGICAATAAIPNGIKERHGFGSDVCHVDTIADLRFKPDVLMECSGAPSVIPDVLGNTAASGITCLAGVTEPGHDFAVDVGALNQTMVLDKNTLFGTVNANKMHYQMAGEALRHADRRWLDMMITRREPAEHWTRSLERRPDDIKVIVEFS
jgi:threonine dehydrogenase-like Zn-dependent dehydrogenase